MRVNMCMQVFSVDGMFSVIDASDGRIGAIGVVGCNAFWPIGIV